MSRRNGGNAIKIAVNHLNQLPGMLESDQYAMALQNGPGARSICAPHGKGLRASGESGIAG
jgi:hypothetical protein